MQAGRLRHRITIQQQVKSQNDMDEWITTYEDWATVWASIEPNRGRMYFEAKQANSEVEGRIIMRYRSGVVPTMRVKYGNRIFKIISIIHPKENFKELNLLYKEELD